MSERPPLPRPLKGLTPEQLAAVRAGNRTLSRGLPGDGTPKTAKEASARCPHKRVDRLLLANERYWTGKPVRGFHVGYVPRVVPLAEPHRCIGGWTL